MSLWSRIVCRLFGHRWELVPEVGCSHDGISYHRSVWCRRCLGTSCECIAVTVVTGRRS